MKSLTATLVLSVISMTGFAQISFQTNNQKIIEDAVIDGLLLVRQEYQLEDTVSLKRYTWNNRPEFGSALSFCVLTENGYVISSAALKPWEQDSKFGKYKDSAYRPVLTDTWYKSAASKDFRKAGCIGTADPEFLADSAWTFVKDTIFGDGFAVDTTSGEKDGWLVWLTASNEESVESDSLTTMTYRHKLTVYSGQDAYEIPSPSSSRHIIGGIYVEPEYPGIGKMELHLVGIVVKTGENWQMVKISPQDKDKPDAENPPADNAGTLTPATPETSAMEETPAAENTPTAPDNKIRNKRQRHEKD